MSPELYEDDGYGFWQCWWEDKKDTSQYHCPLSWERAGKSVTTCIPCSASAAIWCNYYCLPGKTHNGNLFTAATGEQQIKAEALKVLGSTFRHGDVKRIRILTFLQFSLIILHGLIILFLFYFWYVGSLAIGCYGGGVLCGQLLDGYFS